MINFNFKTTTGIYVGTKNVYIAQLKGTPFGLRLVKFGRTEIQPPTEMPVTNLSKEKKQAKVEAIIRAVRENNITAKKVISGLPGQEVLIRYFQMPKIPKVEWETAVKFEAKKYIPFKIEELVWDFHVVLPRGKDVNKMDITFTAVKKEAVQRHLALLEEAGLKVQVLEPAPFSLVRVLTASKQLEKDRPVAIVDIDYGIADINIVKDRTCYLTRDVSLPLEGEVVFEHLVNEIRMSLEYYEKLFPIEKVNKIFLCGEIEPRDWDKVLAEELMVEVGRVNFYKSIKFKQVAPPLNMAVAIGLALHGRIQRAAEVNLSRVGEEKSEVLVARRLLKFSPEIRQVIFRALAISCSGLLILYLAMSRQILQKKKQLEEIISLRPKISLPISSFSFQDLQELENGLIKKKSSLALIVDKKISWTDKFNELPKTLEPGVWLTDLVLSENLTRDNKLVRFLNIKGLAYHREPVQEIGIVTKFVANLKDNKKFSEGFTEIELESMASVDLQGKPAKKFSVSCK